MDQLTLTLAGKYSRHDPSLVHLPVKEWMLVHLVQVLSHASCTGHVMVGRRGRGQLERAHRGTQLDRRLVRNLIIA